MTIPPPPSTAAQPDVSAYTPAPDAPGFAPGRSLAAAVAVFLGGYLLLESFRGNLIMALANVLPVRAAPSIPPSQVAVVILGFVFALLVVVLGLFLARGPLVGRLIGAVVVVVGVPAHAIFYTFRTFGPLQLDVAPAMRIPFMAVAVNTWFIVVLLVGIAWLLARGARLGWLAILATAVLVPVPVALLFNNAEAGIVSLVMYPLAAVVGVAVILAGRPWRD